MLTKEELLKIQEEMELKEFQKDKMKEEQEEINLTFKQEEERLRNIVIKSHIKNGRGMPTEVEINEDLRYLQRVKERLLDKGINWDKIN